MKVLSSEVLRRHDLSTVAPVLNAEFPIVAVRLRVI